MTLIVSCTGGLPPEPTAPAVAAPSPTLDRSAAASPVSEAPATASPVGRREVARSEIRAIQQLTDRVGWIVLYESPGSALWKTVDGGTTWTRLGVPPHARIDELRFVDEMRGWALAFVLRDQPQIGCAQASPAAPCRSAILTTDDGGQSWQERLSIPLVPADPAPLRQLQAVDPMSAWVIAEAGPCGHDGCPREVRATSDGGRTWSIQYRGPERGAVPHSLRFVTRNVGWMLAQRYFRNRHFILGTTDGGRTWRELREAIDAIALDAAGARDAWVLTRDGASCSSSTCSKYELFRTDDGGATFTSLGNPAQFACGGGQVRGPLFASVSVGYAGMDLGTGGADGPGGVMVTRDGGRTWICATEPRNVTAVSAADPLNAWAVSLDRPSGVMSLYRTTDAGATWVKLPLTGVH